MTLSARPRGSNLNDLIEENLILYLVDQVFPFKHLIAIRNFTCNFLLSNNRVGPNKREYSTFYLHGFF